jgi:LysM repeat protein
MNGLRTLVFVIALVFVKGVCGQDLIIHGITPDLYVTHKVAAKETWYSIGRTFNLSPKDIASYNKLNISKPLEIGQTINVPLTNSNFSQGENKQNDEVPVYHIVQEKEWMYRISVNHNKVPIKRIEKWNAITADQAKPGTKLIIGFLKTKDANVLASTAGSKNTVQEKPAAAETSTKETSRPDEEVKNTASDDVKPVANTLGDGGYFKSMFEGGNKTNSGVSGIFKSTSGWNDAKYYALMSNVTVGTIIKITYPQTGKSVFAKVLGELPDMRESAGLSLRISDAAARELGAVTNKFSVEIGY